MHEQARAWDDWLFHSDEVEALIGRRTSRVGWSCIVTALRLVEAANRLPTRRTAVSLAALRTMSLAAQEIESALGADRGVWIDTYPLTTADAAIGPHIGVPLTLRHALASDAEIEPLLLLGLLECWANSLAETLLA